MLGAVESYFKTADHNKNNKLLSLVFSAVVITIVTDHGHISKNENFCDDFSILLSFLTCVAYVRK